MTSPARTGVLGGTFDPIHRGHVAVAKAAKLALGLDEVLLIPLRVPPHRPGAPQAGAADRFAMAALAAEAGGAGLRASDIELSRPGTSYTADTLRTLHAAGLEPWQIYFLTGADAFAEIATWREYPALLDLAHFVVCARPGYPAADVAARLPDLASRMYPAAALRARPILGRGTPTRVFVLNAETPDISSTVIRARARAGLPIADLVPPEVDSYIRRRGLYGAPPAPSPAGESAAGNLHE
jgi:nicotinate-nucleotide adenylyltransferase